jgi:hypothetical protein
VGTKNFGTKNSTFFNDRKPWHILHFWISGFHRRDCGNIGIRKLKKESVDELAKRLLKKAGFYLAIEGDYLDEGVQKNQERKAGKATLKEGSILLT